MPLQQLWAEYPIGERRRYLNERFDFLLNVHRFRSAPRHRIRRSLFQLYHQAYIFDGRHNTGRWRRRPVPEPRVLNFSLWPDDLEPTNEEIDLAAREGPQALYR